MDKKPLTADTIRGWLKQAVEPLRRHKRAYHEPSDETVRRIIRTIELLERIKHTPSETDSRRRLRTHIKAAVREIKTILSEADNQGPLAYITVSREKKRRTHPNIPDDHKYLMSEPDDGEHGELQELVNAMGPVLRRMNRESPVAKRKGPRGPKSGRPHVRYIKVLYRPIRELVFEAVGHDSPREDGALVSVLGKALDTLGTSCGPANIAKVLKREAGTIKAT